MLCSLSTYLATETLTLVPISTVGESDNAVEHARSQVSLLISASPKEIVLICHLLLLKGESLLMGLKEIAVSSGNACTSASLESSYVLRALGVEEDMAHTSIRFGIGRFTTEDEIDRAVQLTVQQLELLREMSPLYEMVKEGINIKDIQWAQH